MKRVLLIGAVLVLVSACSNAYKGLQAATAPAGCLEQLKPDYSNLLFRAEVEVQKQSLGGLLLVKTMPDSTRRVVFTSPTGVRFFDFAFGGEKGFEVISIIEKMNRKLVIESLRNDFALFLFENGASAPLLVRRRGDELYYGYPHGKKTNWYITDSGCGALKRAELGAPRRPLAEIHWWLDGQRVPDSAFIQHHNFRFNIRLTKIAR
ncbi:MAG: hypothetical protein QM664_14565 [Flavihumibacter sp.]